VLPNLFRGYGDGRVERRFQIENLEFQFEGKGGERQSQKAARRRLYKGVIFVEVSYVVLADNY
jgi:hypothetical protein